MNRRTKRILIPVWGCMMAALVFPGCKPSDTPAKKKTAGPHAAAVAALKRIGRTRDAEALQKLCEGKRAGSCECARDASVLLLDRDLHGEALALLKGAPAACRVGNLMAEALARAGKLKEAETKARAILEKSPRDKYATYALAHIRFVRGDGPTAARYARKAAALGRSAPAHLLLGLMAFKVKKYKVAENAFRVMLKIDPSDSAAVFNLALIGQKQNRYRDAREGYLKALRLNPRLADARHNLVVLTHRAGALGEAKHHLKKFAAMVPKNDPRVRALHALLRKPPPRPAPGKPPAVRPGPGTPPAVRPAPRKPAVDRPAPRRQPARGGPVGPAPRPR